MTVNLDAHDCSKFQALSARLGLAQIVHAQRIDSTNAWAAREPFPPHHATVYIADQQLAGRGRLGRHWQSPPGSALYMSLAQVIQRPPAALNGLSLAVGVSIAKALHRLGFLLVKLKWPNDLVIIDSTSQQLHKLGGILIEMAGVTSHSARIVIGIGINIAMPDDFSVEQPWIDLARCDTQQPVSRDRLLEAVLEELVPSLPLFEQQGFAVFHNQWQTLDALYGRNIDIRGHDQDWHGRNSGIADDGALLIETDRGMIRIHSAEVSVRS